MSQTPQPFANQELPESDKQTLPTSDVPEPPARPVVVEFDRALPPKTPVTGRIKGQAWSAASRGCDRASVLYDRMQRQVQVVRHKTDETLRNARVQGRYWANEYPLQFVAGVAGTAFVCGMLLRFWRSSRYE
jgi:hypothetical protein